MTTAPSSTPLINIQGNSVNQSQIDPPTFFKYTRRQRGKIASSIASFAGLGETDQMELKQTGILGAIDVKFTGSLTVTPGSGSVATTAKWPYSLFKVVKVAANGQSNLINCDGIFIKAREFIGQPGLTDRGVNQTVGGTTVDQGTLSLDTESWGVGQSTSTIASGTYDVVLSLRVPIAWDLVKLFGALYLQTSSTSVDLEVQWAPVSDLFTLTGGATVALTGGWMAEGVVFTIPNVGGTAVIPDLSTFHTLTQTSTANVGQTANETVLSGQGVHKQLMRVMSQVWNNGSPGSPLAMNATNFGQIGWGYGLSEDPELWQDGDSMKLDVERRYGVDMSRYGLSVIDFAQHWAFRDAVDEGSASQIRLLTNVLSALTSPRLVYAQEVMLQAASAAA